MRKFLLSILATTVLLGATGLCSADELKPVVTVSFAGYDRLFADLDTIGRLAGSPDLGKGIDMMFKLMATQGKGLPGLDTKLPWGAVLQTDGKVVIPVVGFVPATDLKALMEVAMGNPQAAQNIKLNGDVYEIHGGTSTYYVKQVGKWAAVAEKTDNLVSVPADPVTLLGELPKRYCLATRVSVQNLPKETREQMLAFLLRG